MQETDDGFYDRADAHIELSNKQVSKEITRGKVSASFMYSLSRFNAFVSATGFTNKEDMKENKEANQGRTASYPTVPSQIPACGFPAQGSSKLLALHVLYSEA